MDEPLSGVVADVPTPRNMDGSVNLDIIQVIVDRMIHAGVSAILVAGKVGENETSPSEDEVEKQYLFDSSEEKRVMEAYLQAAKGKIKIIAGIPPVPLGYIDEWRQGYQDLMCYAVMFMNGVTGLEACYKLEEFQDTHTPLMYCFRDLNKFEDVAYGNNSPLDEQYLTYFVMRAQTGIKRMFNGDDSLCFSALSLGAPGIITGMAAILPYHCVEFYRTLTIEENLTKARLQWEFLSKVAYLLKKGDYSANVKAAMRFIGIDTELNKDENNNCNSIDLERLRKHIGKRKNDHFDDEHT